MRVESRRNRPASSDAAFYPFLLMKCDVITERKALCCYNESIKFGRKYMTTKKRRIAIVETTDCVACGCCVKVCPMGAIHIDHGIAAQVDRKKCVGCGKCARECPASVIEIREVEIGN